MTVRLFSVRAGLRLVEFVRFIQTVNLRTGKGTAKVRPAKQIRGRDSTQKPP